MLQVPLTGSQDLNGAARLLPLDRFQGSLGQRVYQSLQQAILTLTYRPGEIVRTPPLRFRFVALPGFSTAGSSKVPHNALHDARSLRDHVLSIEDN